MEKPAKKETVKQYLIERLKNIPLTVVMSLYLAFCIGSSIYLAVIGEGRNCLFVLIYALVVPVFYFAEKTLHMRVPIAYTIFLMLFVLFCALGACFNFYTLIPHLDDVLHAAWGIVFSTIGIILIKALIGAPKTKKAVIAYVLFGLGFAMLLSVVWEIYEFSGDRIIADMDMQQDTIIKDIESFGMYPDPAHPAPDNLHTWKVYGIDHTVLYDADGNEIGRIVGGYLDIGLMDTMMDLIYCFAFVAGFSVILAIDWCYGKRFYRLFIPALVSEVEERMALRAGVTAVEDSGAVEEEQPEAEAAEEVEAVEEQPQEEQSEGEQPAKEQTEN